MSVRKNFLTPEVCLRLRELLIAGATRDAAAEAVGISRRRLDTRLRDQLRDLRVGQGRRELDRSIKPDPNREEIAYRCALIRSTWTAEEWGLREPRFGPAGRHVGGIADPE